MLVICLVPIFLTLTLVFTRIDPYALALYYAYPEKDLMSSIPIAFLTNGISFACAVEVCNIIRLLMIPLVTTVHQYRKFIRYVYQVSLNDTRKAIKIYGDFYVAHVRNRELTGPGVQIVMGVGFVDVVVANALSIAGYAILPVYIYWFPPVNSIVTLFIIMTTLPFATFVHEFSLKMLNEWKLRVCLVTGSRRYKILAKQLKTFRPLGFYCGHIGILKNESKTLYLWGIFLYTINLIMFVKQV